MAVVAGITLVAARDGGAQVLSVRPTMSTDPVVVPVTTDAVVARPECRHIVHLGDSNLGITLDMFEERYDRLGLDARVDFANGRGAHSARDGGTSALEAIADATAAVTPDGRCWVIALSGTDAAEAWRDGVDPSGSIRAIIDALGDDPVLWVTPVLVSTRRESNLEASTAYNRDLGVIAAEHPNITILDWQDIALDHLDQFQDDGIHYQRPLYVLLVDTVITAEERTWVLQATP